MLTHYFFLSAYRLFSLLLSLVSELVELLVSLISEPVELVGEPVEPCRTIFPAEKFVDPYTMNLRCIAN
jgi:hypothetical protein